MIYTDVPSNHEALFRNLLTDTVRLLNAQAKKQKSYLQKHSGAKFEEIALEHLKEAAKDSLFENSFTLKSGRSFPDIISQPHGMGVEVKTKSKGSSWTSMGNSIRETSRVGNVDHIFLLFANLYGTPKFKVRKYEECLRNVEVTHSPRYRIDMNTPPGETIFDKVGISYNELRKLENPFRPIVEYHRELLKDRGDVWYLDSNTPDESWPSNEDSASQATEPSVGILYWSGLDKVIQDRLRLEMIALFPEVLGPGKPGSMKYYPPASWLLQRHRVIHPSFRDIFTGGRRSSLIIDNIEYKNVPTFITRRIAGNLDKILTILDHIPLDDIRYYWERPHLDRKDVLPVWMKKFKSAGQQWLKNSELTISTLLRSEDIPLDP